MIQTRKAFLRRRLRRALLLCTLICIGGLLLSATARAAGDGRQRVVLQLRWHHQFQFAGYYMAKELGYYRDAGLDVEIRAGSKDVSPVDEVLGGAADFGIDGSGLLADYAKGRPVVAVAAVFQKSPLRLIARADRGIHRIEDLAGRRVMLLPGARSLALIAMLHQTALLDRIVRIDSSANIDDLIEDRVDAFNAYSSNEPYALEQAGIQTVVFDPAAYGIQFYSDVLFTDRRTAASRPDMVAAFREASLRGWLYALDNPERAIDIIRSRYAPGKTRPHLAFEAAAVRESVMSDVIEIGHMSELRWAKIRDQLNALGLVPPQMPLDGFMLRPPDLTLDWTELEPYLLPAAIALAVAFAVIAIVIRKNVQLQDEVEERLAAERRAQHLATHDYLTGLPNRMLLMDRLGGALARARRHDTTPLVAFIDLDNFKQINDRHGHERGDELLAGIARQVKLMIREEDTFARMGGDEFVLLIDDMPAARAGHEAERLRLAIRSATAALKTDVQVSASIGMLSVLDPEGLTPDSALRMADDLMYEVKHGSKDDFLLRSYDGGGTDDRTNWPKPAAETGDALG
jgi:diguanylate cyclase (GGDEF)-like protein